MPELLNKKFQEAAAAAALNINLDMSEKKNGLQNPFSL